MYAVPEDMRYGVHPDPKKEKIGQQGDLSTLYKLHQELDQAVAEAYGWPVDMPAEDILSRLLELNHQRAEKKDRAQ